MGDEFLWLSGGDRVSDARICFMFFGFSMCRWHFVCSSATRTLMRLYLVTLREYSSWLSPGVRLSAEGASLSWVMSS